MADDPMRYTRVARALHWLIALLVLSAIPAGLAMVRIGSGPLQDWLFDFHRSLGFVVLVLIVVRIVWRLGHRPPPLPAGTPALQAVAAHVVHGALYLLLLIAPIVGWLATNAYGAPIAVFRLFELPVLIGKDEAVSKLLFGLHEVLGIAIAALVVVHIAAALFHQLVVRNGLIRRMWPI